MFSRLEILHVDDPTVSGAAIEVANMVEPIFVVPFPKHTLSKALALSDRVILFVGDGGAELLLARFDTQTKQTTQTATLTVRGSSRNLQLSKDGRLLYVTGEHVGIACIDVETLTVWRAFDCALLQGGKGKLIKRDDYFRIDTNIKDGDCRVFHSDQLRAEYLDPAKVRMFLGTSHLHDEFGPKSLVCLNSHLDYAKGVPGTWHQSLLEADIEAAEVRCMEILSGKETEKHALKLVFLSALHRLGLSKVKSTLPFSSGTGTAAYEAFGRNVPDVGKHFDVCLDGVLRFGVALDQWDLRCEPCRVARQVVRMASAAELNLESDGPLGGRERLSDSEFEAGLLFQAAEFANGPDREFTKRHPTRWSKVLRKDVRIHLPYNSRGLSECILDIIEEPASGACWVLFIDCSLRRVSPNGELGPLITLAPASPRWTRNEVRMDFEPDGTIRLTREGIGTYRFDPSSLDPHARRVTVDVTEPAKPVVSHREAFKAFVRKKTVNVVVLKDWSPEACAMALREQRMRIDSQFESLVAGSQFAKSLEFRYVGDQNYDEPHFFQRLVDDRTDVAQELRALLTTYLRKIGSGGEGKQPWQHGQSGTAALGSAMRALVLLDPDALDVFRVYLAKRDGEHEEYSRETILPDYVRTHGWRNRGALRFGIYFAFNMYWGGIRGGRVNWNGLMAAAAQMVNASEFVTMLLAEAGAFNLNPQWNDQDESYYLSCFYAGLDKADPFQAAVGEALIRRRPDLASNRNP